MSVEYTPQQLDPYLTTSDEAIDAADANLDVSPNQESELLQEGARQLANSLSTVAETGDPTAVKSYLSDVLADTDRRVPGAERAAAFALLAGEQRGEIRRSLKQSGLQMLDTLGSNSRMSRKELQQTSPRAQHGIRAAKEAHEQEVGRPLRAQADLRRLTRGQEIAEQTARRGFGAVTTHADTFAKWSKSQLHEITVYDGHVKEGRAHERALGEAAETVQPDYPGEQRDLSRIIDEHVKQIVADRLQSLIAESQAAGSSSEAAILELISQQPDAKDEVIIGNLGAFAQRYARIAGGGSRIKTAAAESERLVKSFAGRGRDGYQQARRPNEAAGVYQMQQRTLDQATEAAKYVLNEGADIMKNADHELQDISRKLAIDELTGSSSPTPGA